MSRGKVDESLYEAIQFLQDADSVYEVKTVIAGELRIVKDKNSTKLEFENDLIKASEIIDGKVVYPTREEDDPEFDERVIGFSSSIPSKSSKPYTYNNTEVFARLRAISASDTETQH